MQGWGAFNPNNLKGKYLDSLRNDVYSGFATKSVERWESRGAGSGRANRHVGYDQVFNPDYYKEHTGWRGIGDKLGININSKNDVRQLFDYVNGYKPPAKKVATPAAPPTPRYNKQTLSTNVKKTTFDTSAYDKQIAKLGKSLSGLQDQLKSNQATYAKNLANQTTNFNKLLGTQQSNFNKNMAAQTEKYDNNMASLKNSLAETMSNKQQPSVGVKTSGMTQQSAAMGRQGVKGTFGRTGLRIKGIKDNSLNI